MRTVPFPIINVAKAQTEGGEAAETGNQVHQHKDCNATHITKATIVLDKPCENSRLQMFSPNPKNNGQTFTSV